VDNGVTTNGRCVDCFVVTDIAKVLRHTLDPGKCVDIVPLKAHHSIPTASKHLCDPSTDEAGSPGD
jgi:hypothetical protein